VVEGVRRGSIDVEVDIVGERMGEVRRGGGGELWWW
jgi:hypothetical protein